MQICTTKQVESSNDEIHGSLEMSQQSRQKFVVSVMNNLAAFAMGERMKSAKEAVRKPRRVNAGTLQLLLPLLPVLLLLEELLYIPTPSSQWQQKPAAAL